MRSLIGAAALLAASGFPSLHAQDAVMLGECEDLAQVVMTHSARMGEDGGRGLYQTDALARDGRGRLLAWVPQSESGGAVFAADGSFLGSFGGAGTRGPGSQAIVAALVVTPGDTIHAFDRASLRRHDFSPDLAFIGATSLPGAPGFNKGAARLPGGDWVINANIETPDRAGWPLHLLDDEGGIVRSFGSLRPTYRSDFVGSVDRTLAAAGEGLVWTAHLTQYRLELWDTSNTLRRALARDLPWFPRWVRDNPIGPDAPRKPMLRDIRIDDEARLWTLITRTSERFADFVEERADGGYSWASISGYHASVVEVIDIAAGCVAARGETEAMLIASLGDGFYAGYEESDAGRYFEVWRLEVVPR